MDQKRAAGSWKKFFVLLAGETFRAHKDWISKFNSIGQSEVKSPGESDYILLFCPIVTQARTNISEALKKIPVFAGGKKIILIVMHHAFSPQHITGDSKGLVENRDVVLVVDCLFDKGCLLKSRSYDRAWSEIKRYFGDPEKIEVPVWKGIKYWVQEKRWSLGVSFGTVAVVILASVAYHIWHKQ